MKGLSSMYEGQTYQVILDRMLARVPNNYDKREGSIIYNALAPAAAEMAQMYIELGINVDLSFADTATGEYLSRRTSEFGVFRILATKAIWKGEFFDNNNNPFDIPLNSRFSIQGLNYIAISKISTGVYQMECETAGRVGNELSGNLIPLENIQGLARAILSEIIIHGEDDETDEHLRARFKQTVSNPARDGNVAQYMEWASTFPGVGAYKVFPLWNGGNTVKVAITNTNFQVAEQGLVDAFQNYLDPNSEGLGNGVAPIGAIVTVSGGVEKPIDINGNVVLAEGYSSLEGVTEAITNYIGSITYIKNNVSYLRLGATIIDVPSVGELTDLKVNGGVTDIPLVGEEIPVLSNLNLTVMPS